MSESLSLDGFKKSKSYIPKDRNLDPVTNRLPAVGLAGGNLGVQELEKKKSNRNQKIKI